MTDITVERPADQTERAERSARLLKKRHASEFRFKLYGVFAILVALVVLVSLLTTIISGGYSAFYQTEMQLEVTFTPEKVDPKGDQSEASFKKGNFLSVFKEAVQKTFPDVTGRKDKKDVRALYSPGSYLILREMVMEDPSLVGKTVKVWLPADDVVDMLNKGFIDRNLPETDRPISDKEIAWIEKLEKAGHVEMAFNSRFFTNGNSREPELAGIWAALKGSFLTMVVTLSLTFPVGVAAAIYLEEFAPKNPFTDLIEVNINNLAAVPSIVFGLLGLAVFLGMFNMPRSSPLVGGMVLALMTLPTIIIAARASLKAVPPSIREAALGMGASRWQAVSHHVLPLAMPGILTGTIIGMAQALGETAPLLMIGMVAFIVDPPGGLFSGGLTDAATVLPVQIFLWSDMPERAFVEKTNAAIIVLLSFLVVMNLLAIVLRKKFERRW